MTQIDTKSPEESELKRFLYNEMTLEERERMEEKFFDDDNLFFEITDLENRLVDLYIRKQLGKEELQRFERSLKQLPERRAKISNAAALQTFIEEERKEEKSKREAVPEASGRTFWQKFAEFFTIKTHTLGYAMGGLLLLFLLSTTFLFLETRRQANELAHLQSGQNTSRNQREIELQNQLANVEKRENELRQQIDNERDASGDLTEELERERKRREQFESELERLQKQREDARPVQTPQTASPAPIIATVLLTPTIGSRGAGGTNAQTITIERATKRLAVRLALPVEINIKERVSVQLNDKNAAQNLAIRVSRNGQKSVQLTIATQDLADGGLNRLSISDASGKQISTYVFTMQKK